MYREDKLQEISTKFQIYGEIEHAELCKIGHINETYTATYLQGGVAIRYIHQKINRDVFKHPEEVMQNMCRVTSHIRSRLEKLEERDITRKVLTIVPTRENKPIHRDPDGHFWRTFVFVEKVRSHESVRSPAQALEAGRAIGRFQSLLSDLPGKRLHETIPDFHHARKRFDHFKKSVEMDHYNRAASAKKEIQFALRNESMADIILDAVARGEIPERVTHNDTKFNNVLLDDKSGEAMCVVDLDTVMPGVGLYDFGDMVRTTSSPTLEDERDLSKVRLRLPVFRELARGYLAEAGSFLTPRERSLIAFSGQLMTLVIGLRFLTDYLSGDSYFRVHRSAHNLDRCRTQFKLVEHLLRHGEVMQKYVDELGCVE